MNKKAFFCAAATLVFGALTIAQPIEQGLIDSVGWTTLWIASAPLKGNEKIDRMFVEGDCLYLLTNTAYLFSIHRQNGNVRFVVPLAAKRLPICDPISVGKELWFMVGNELVIVDVDSGQIVQRRFFDNVGNSFGCGIAVGQRLIYLAGSDRRLHVFDREGFWRHFSASADDKTLIQWPIWAGDRVIFNTQGGAVVAMAADSPTKLWQFNTTGALRAPMAADDGFVYVGGDDTKLYKLHLQTGRMAWQNPFLAGAKIRHAPVVGRLATYLFVPTRGLYAIDKNTGALIWHLKNGTAILTETADSSIAFCQPGVLAAMEHPSGQKRFELNASNIRHTARFFGESKLYLATSDGEIIGIAAR